jgi:hypothetical protein
MCNCSKDETCNGATSPSGKCDQEHRTPFRVGDVCENTCGLHQGRCTVIAITKQRVVFECRDGHIISRGLDGTAPGVWSVLPPKRTKTVPMWKNYNTRDGRDVRILCTDGLTRTGRPVMGYVHHDNGHLLMAWEPNGTRARVSTVEHPVRVTEYDSTYDLVEVKEKAKIHLCLWYKKSDPRITGGAAYSNEAAARAIIAERRLVDSPCHYWYECIEKEVE